MLNAVSAPAAAFAAGCSASTIRALRTKGYIRGFGRRHGKGHVYTPSEVARLAIVNILTRYGISLRRSFDLVAERERVIDGLLYLTTTDNAKRYTLTIAVDPDGRCVLANCDTAQTENTPDDLPVTIRINATLVLRSAVERMNNFRTTPE